MSRTETPHDFDHFDEWDSIDFDDDLYGESHGELSDEWEDDGAIAQVREEPVISADSSIEEPLVESAEVFSLMERANAKKSRDWITMEEPSEDELLAIEIEDEDDEEIIQPEDEASSSLPSTLRELQSETTNPHLEKDLPDDVSIDEAVFAEGEDDVVLSEAKDLNESELVVQPLFTGVACSLPTFFDEDDEVEYKTTARLAKRLTAQGATAIVVATTDGEGATLSVKERKKLIAEVSKSADGFIIGDITAPSIRQCVELANDAADAGANAFVITLDKNVHDPYRLCESIHEKHYDMPILIRLTGDPLDLPISPEFLYDLPISGVIDATGDANYLLHLVSVYSGPIYVGSSSLVLMAHSLDLAGVILPYVALGDDLVDRAFAGDAPAQVELSTWERECGGATPKSIKLALENDFLIAPTTRD
jgi:hypothetical protein